jgi:hypothetical protein
VFVDCKNEEWQGLSGSRDDMDYPDLRLPKAIRKFGQQRHLQDKLPRRKGEDDLQPADALLQIILLFLRKI